MPNSPFEDYVILLNSQPENKTYYECFVISHSLLSKTYYIAANTQDITANDKDGIQRVFLKANVKQSRAINSNDLSQSAIFTFGDVGNILADEMKRIPLDNDEDLICEWYQYHSEHLDSPVDRIAFNVQNIPRKKGGFSLRTGVTELNKNKTGEIFSLDPFESLRGL